MIFLLANPETWNWGNTWTVTGLGFGIVLALLFILVFILIFFGWIMQKLTAPKAPKAENPVTVSSAQCAPNAPTQPAAPASKPASPADDTAAIAMALYLASRNTKHDAPTSMIKPQARETAWNTKSIGLNNIGF